MQDPPMTSPTPIAERLRARNERFQSSHGNCLYYAGHDSILDCEAAVEIDTLTAALAAAEERAEKAETAESEQDDVATAIGSVRFMDPPDGGGVTLAEQVGRMRETLAAVEARCAEWAGSFGRKCSEATALQARCAELERHLTRMTQNFRPFTSKPMGAPHSYARLEQEARVIAWTEARYVATPEPQEPK